MVRISEDEEHPEDFDVGFIEAVLWMGGITERPTLAQFEDALRDLAAYCSSHTSECMA